MASSPSKFAGLTDLVKRPATSTPAPATIVTRMGGKRSNPEVKQYTVLLKKATQREAANIVRDRDDGTDFSDLVQQLLEEWLAKREK